MKKTIEECHCQKCGHKFWPRKPGRSHSCPACNNVQWDQGPKKPGGRGRTKAISDAEEKSKD